MKQREKWSCFVLHEDGYWEQPTYRLSRDMTEEEFRPLVLEQWGRKYFLVVGVCPDEECPDDDFVRELP
jgi:hypothetical protein